MRRARKRRFYRSYSKVVGLLCEHLDDSAYFLPLSLATLWKATISINLEQVVSEYQNIIILFGFDATFVI